MQLSSPIESKTITKIFDPLDVEEKEEPATSKDDTTTVEEKKDEVKVEIVEEGDGDSEEKPEIDEGNKEESEKGEKETDASDKEEEGEDTNDDDEPKDDDAQDKPKEETKSKEKLTSHVTFQGVDTSVATLTVEVFDVDIPLGTSATTYDIGPLCEVDVLKGITKKISDLDVAIVPEGYEEEQEQPQDEESNDEGEKVEEIKDDDEKEGGDATTTAESEDFQDAIEEENDSDDANKEVEGVEVELGEKIENESKDNVTEKETNDEVKEEDKDNEEPANSEESKEKPTSEETKKDVSTKVIVPTCTVSLKVEYNASSKDQGMILNEKYNAAVARQTVAVEKLRRIATAVRRAQLAAEGSDKTGVSGNKKPSVKPGFLKKIKKEPMFLVRWYNKTLGPNSLLRKVYPIAKNYVLFFGGVILMHYQGHQLALPPPV